MFVRTRCDGHFADGFELEQDLPLDKDAEITGPMTATLWAMTEGKDTDWNVMLEHVYPDGRAERIQDGVMRASAMASILNTGGGNERDTRYVVVRQRILRDRVHLSFVRLPIIPR